MKTVLSVIFILFVLWGSDLMDAGHFWFGLGLFCVSGFLGAIRDECIRREVRCE